MKQLYIVNKNRTLYQMSRIKRYISRYTAFEIAATTLILMFGLWLLLSFVDVINNNMGTCIYAKWNLLIILSDRF